MRFDVPEVLSFRHPSSLPTLRSTPPAPEPARSALRLTGADGEFAVCNGEYHLVGVKAGVATFRSSGSGAVLHLQLPDKSREAAASEAPSDLPEVCGSSPAAPWLQLRKSRLRPSAPSFWAVAVAFALALCLAARRPLLPAEKILAASPGPRPADALQGRRPVDAAQGRRQALLATAASPGPANPRPEAASRFQVLPDGSVTLGRGGDVTNCQPVDALPLDKKVAVFPAAVDGSDGIVTSAHILMEVGLEEGNPATFLVLDGALLNCGHSLPFGLPHGNVSEQEPEPAHFDQAM